MVYLDHAATTPILPSVKQAMFDAYDKYYANASSLHTPGHLALEEIERARESLAQLIHADPSEIIFTSGASESNNTVIHTFAGQPIYISPYEHHSLLEAMNAFSRGLPEVTTEDEGASPVTTGASDPSPEKCILASYMLASNELGDIFDLPHDAKYLHSDLTQCLGKIEIDVKALDLDYATFSAHKIGGPLGIGALYVRNGAPFKPLIIGGNQEHKRRGGTYNTPAIIGFGVACEYCLQNKTWELYESQVKPLRDRLAHEILTTIPGSQINTDLTHSLPHILNVSFRAAEGESIQLYLDNAGVIVSTGSACASGDIKPSHVLMAKFHDAEIAHSSIRFSLGLDTTPDDIDYTMSVLPDIIKKIQGISTL